jgi:hypothetical protein
MIAREKIDAKVREFVESISGLKYLQKSTIL